MRSIKIIATLATVLILAIIIPIRGSAQNELSLNLNYSIGIPAGSFHDYISDVSYRGWTANLLYAVNNKLSVGFGTGFQDFYQKNPRQVYKLNDGGDISAVVTNSVQAIPVLAIAKYNLVAGTSIQPYVGIGAGGNLVMYRQYLGEFSNSRNKFLFAVRPEAGVFVPFNKGNPSSAGININGAFNYMPYNYDGLDNINNWGVGIGVRFPLR